MTYTIEKYKLPEGIVQDIRVLQCNCLITIANELSRIADALENKQREK